MDLRVLTFALSIFLAFDLGEAIKCHVCNGHKDAQCADPFKILAENGEEVLKTNEFLKDCDSKATMCRKIYQDVRGVVRVIRSCAWEKHPTKEKTSCYKTVMEEYNTYVCSCEEDGCNGSENIQVSALLIAILPIITLGLFHQ